MTESASWKPKVIASREPLGTHIRGATCLYRRPRLAHRIAAIIACWSHIEWVVVDVFGYVIDAEGWVAAELMSDVRKFEARVGIMIRHIKRKFGAEKAKEVRSLLSLTNIKELARERDKLAHGVFNVFIDDPDIIVRVDGWGEREVYYQYDKEQLDRMYAKFTSFADEVDELRHWMVENAPAKLAPGRSIHLAHPLALASFLDLMNRTIAEKESGMLSQPDQSQTEELDQRAPLPGEDQIQPPDEKPK